MEEDMLARIEEILSVGKRMLVQLRELKQAAEENSPTLEFVHTDMEDKGGVQTLSKINASRSE